MQELKEQHENELWEQLVLQEQQGQQVLQKM